jgi:hypothetical protein
MYISCIGVVFATIWAGGLQQYERRAAHSHSISTDFRSGMGPTAIHPATDIDARGNQTRLGTEFVFSDQEKHLEDLDVLVASKEHKSVKLYVEEPLEPTILKVSTKITER